MCTQPILITNPTRTYVPDLTKYKLLVPCGKCDQCRDSLSNDWFVRIYNEIKRCKANNGKTLFVTFTYRNSCLPCLRDGDLLVPGFSKKDKNRFMSSLRKHFERDGINGIRYIWCCEYGLQTAGTHRPHYHALLHFPADVWSKYTVGEVQRIIERYWKHGFVRWSKEIAGGAVVENDYAAKYVSKYCVKDVSFFNQPIVNKYLYNEKGELIKKHFDKFKYYLPRHWQSKSYGINLEDEILDLKHVDVAFVDGLKFSTVDSLKQNKSEIYFIPQYIQNRLCYKYLPDGRRVLSEFGSNLKKRNFFYSLQRSFENYSKKFRSDYVASKIRDVDVPSIVPNCSTIEEYVTLLNNLMAGRSVVDLMLYKKCWQGSSSEYKSVLDNLDKLSSDDFIQASLEKYMNDISFDISQISAFSGSFFKELEDSTDDVVKSLKMNFYNDCERFKNFDMILNLLSKVDNLSLKRRAAYKFHERLLKSDLRYKFLYR